MNDALATYTMYGVEAYSWIKEGQLLASIYPPSMEYIEFLRDAEGIKSVLNLDMKSWPEIWTQISGLNYLHVPIVDMSVPSDEQIERSIEFIDRVSVEGPVMIHCIAGIGRTGTMIGLYLVQKGMEPQAAIDLIRDRRGGSIQTTAQELLIYNWKKRNGGD